jgi:hypothetical protein
MNDDDFNGFLASALSPPRRDEDLAFVGQVQQRLRVERALRAERLRIARKLAMDLAGLGTVATALLALSRSPAVSAFVSLNPSLALGMLLIGAAGWIALQAGPDSAGPSRATI